MYPYLCRVICLTLFVVLAAFNLSAQESDALSSEVNSSYNELDPVISPDGMQLYFTRANHPQNIGGVEDKGDIWYALRKPDGTWSTPQNLGRPLNDKFINSVVGFSADGNKMYLRNLYINDHNSQIKQGISMSKRIGGKWSYPENMEVRYFKNASQHQSMSIAGGGSILMMAIESYGTYGAEDLYVSFADGKGNWSGPKNLGAQINTGNQELAPFLAKDGKTLFFSSNGHGDSQGSRDIYMSKRLDDSWQNWSEPVNLGPAINTEGAELHFLLDPVQEVAYYTSTLNSNGYGDMRKIRFSLDLEEPDPAGLVPDEPLKTLVSIPDPAPEPRDLQRYSLLAEIIDSRSGERLQGYVEFKMVSPTTDLDPEFYEEKLTFSKGKLTARLIKGQQYRMSIIVPGYLVYEQPYLADADKEELIRLQALTTGSTFNLEHVLFEVGTAHLLDSSYLELDKVKRMMDENPGLIIELAGHTDNRGDSRLNYLLSLDRVKTVKRYLVDKGIEGNRVKEKAYGGSRPIADNTQEETRRLNRRVEFTIISQ